MKGIYYDSTRGKVKNITASEAVIKGIADDGGLFVPSVIPDFRPLLHSLEKADYKETAYAVLKYYFNDFSDNELKNCIDRAYDDKFDTREIAPVKRVGSDYFLELFHGPTLAFKDMALSILPHLMKTASEKQQINKELVILTATSGDTGKAALEGFKNIEGIKVIVFFPEDGVSEIQKRQMTTHNGSNTFVIGVKGNFDSAQSGVKDIFTDQRFAESAARKGYLLSSANSINIGRLFPQVVYYFYAYLKLCRSGEISIGDKINAAVPTGNFGNILAAYYAKMMGLPIDKLICASNENKVLCDFLSTGEYDISNRKFITTISPSMDILISSNLERLLYLISGRDGELVSFLMEQLKKKGRFEVPDRMKDNLKDFYGGFADDSLTGMSIRQVFSSYGYLMDTHTSVAYSVLKRYRDITKDDTRTIIVSTASPYKFTSAVMNSIDINYRGINSFELLTEMSRLENGEIPKPLRGLEASPVIHNIICSSSEMKSITADILRL